jgi:hypothetical protein
MVPWHRSRADRSDRMAVTPTFPSRGTLRRFRFRPVDILVGVVLRELARSGCDIEVHVLPAQAG